MSRLADRVRGLASAGDEGGVVALAREFGGDPLAAAQLARLLHESGEHALLEAVVRAVEIPGWPEGSGLLLRARQLDAQGDYTQADAVLAALDAQIAVVPPPLEASPTPTTLMFRNAPLLESLVAILARLAERQASVSVHVAACSSGAEVHSLAIALHEAGLRARVRITGSDVRADLVEAAREGKITAGDLQRVPVQWRARHVVRDSGGGGWRVAGAATIGFSVVDLLAGPPADMHDVIVANNMLVHFPDPQKLAILGSLANGLRPGGVLCIGGLRNDALLTQLAEHDLHPVVARSSEIYEAWRIQRDAWYRLPRQYWTLPPWRPGPQAAWLHAALFAKGSEAAGRHSEAVAQGSWRLPT